MTEHSLLGADAKTDLVTGGVPSGERDIDVVLVTGAGASRAFGVNGILDASVRFQDFGAGTQTMSAQGVMDQWHSQAVHHFGEKTGLIHESLNELFAEAAVDLDGAAQAYQGLFHSLGLSGPDTRLVYATTNYDTIGEHAIFRSGGFPDWGQPPTLEQGNQTQQAMFILGRSLNDQYLLRALAQTVQPLDRIAVSVLADEQDHTRPDQSAGPVIAKITQVLGNAAVIPMRFGGGLDEGTLGIRTWTEKLAGNNWI